MGTRRNLVYDLPTRLFHWAFAALFLTAFLIAKRIDSDSPTFSFHMLAGLTLGYLTVLRIIWGFVGTRYARFFGFALKPLDLVGYFRGMLSGDKRRWAGHNPASSWAALAMIGLALGLATTGYLMTSGPNKETYEDIHELMANGFMIVVLSHIAGVVLHTIRHRELIGLSMLDGKKDDVADSLTISSARPLIGFLLVGLLAAFVLYLAMNFNSETRSLRFFGASLQLGEDS